MQMTGARVVCEALIREDVKVIFGIPGGAILPFYDALWHYPQIRHVLMRHEQASAHAAEAYSRVTGEVGVCVATSGPGATNLITGLTAAKMDSTPLVAITGQVARPFIGTEAFQECATSEMAAPLVKKTFLILDPSDIASTIHEAFIVAKSGRPGPVLVDLPKDVQAELVEYEPLLFPEETANNHSQVDDGLIKHAAQIINESERPLIIAGNGVHISNASEELKALAEKGSIPVINTLHGTGSFPRDHHLSMGMLGMHGMYSSNIATCEADVILGIGARFDDRVIGRPGSFGENAKIIKIDIEPEHIQKNVPADLGIISSAKPALEVLIPHIRFKKRNQWFERLSQLSKTHPSTEIPEGDIPNPQYVLSALADLLSEVRDPVVVTGVGQHQMWAAQFIRLQEPRSFVTSGGLGVMGFEVPAAIGAQVGKPNSTVWSIAGDGGFQMTLQELATIAQERLPIKFAIINNQFLGMVRQWQESFYDHHYKAVEIPPIDHVKLCEAYGIPALCVNSKEEVQSALVAATSENGPFLIDFRVSPEENVYPMVPPGASLAETVEDPRVITKRQDFKPSNEGSVSYP